MEDNHLVTLDSLPDGHEASIVALQGGHGFVGRLSALGFTPGARVRMVRNPRGGPLIVSILDTQIALGRGQAHRILVRPQ